MNIQELKTKSSENLISQAEELGIENASTLRNQEILFSILKFMEKCWVVPLFQWQLQSKFQLILTLQAAG